MSCLIIQVSPRDNVAVAVQDLAAGTEVWPGLFTREAIPQAHKIALTPIPEGGEIIRYGVVLGYAKAPIAPPATFWASSPPCSVPPVC